MSAKKKGFAQRDFNDAGTGRRFKAGEALDLDAGVYRNYEAAGLAGPKAPEKPKTPDESAPKAA